MHFKKKPKKMIALNEDFTCEYCGRFVQAIKTGGSYRNHCPFCLTSKHVDTDTPGDRKNECHGLMKAISAYSKKTGEYVLLHECTRCKFRRYNRIAGDDDMDLVIELSKNPIHINS
jgi:hypothetical protein